MSISLLSTWMLLSTGLYLILKPNAIHRVFGGFFLVICLLQLSQSLSQDRVLASFCLLAACLAFVGVIGAIPFIRAHAHHVEDKVEDKQV